MQKGQILKNPEYLNMLPNYIVPTNHEIVQETYNNILKKKVLQLTTSAVSYSVQQHLDTLEGYYLLIFFH